MKIKTVYYNYVMAGSEESFLDPKETDFFPEDYFEEPQPALKGYDMNYRHAKCPAWKEYHKNVWSLHQSFPLGMIYKSEEKFLSTNLSQDIFEQYFMLGDGWLDGEHPEIQFKQGYCFWTDEKDVWIEQFQHPTMTRLGLDVVAGSFPISVWQRPINLGFKITSYDQNIWLEKGAPVCYVRFSSARTRDVKFKLEKRPVPEKVAKRQLQDLWLKDWHNNYSWDLIKSRLKKEEESQCPFKWMWKK